MRCIYCKSLSDQSRSVEHVVPESIGNHTLVLRPGIVCDDCNNYFSRKVEAPFLNSPAIQLLRHEQVVTNKRGRVPTIRAYAPGVGEASMHAGIGGMPRQIVFDSAAQANQWLLGDKQGVMLTKEIITPPSPGVTSRFLAKVAIGCLADRLQDAEGGLAYLVDEPALDRLRDHARRGSDPNWPVSVRRIYSEDARWSEGDEVTQKLWELDLFEDEDGYLYSILVLFGIELTIHVGEPDIGGYRQWLLRHGGVSPLYSGRYASEMKTLCGTHDRRTQQAIVSYLAPTKSSDA